MGMIINIDKALELRSDYNILREPLNEMLKSQQEAWERENPIDMLFTRGSIATFQETYTSSIGFAHAFAETSDYAVGPIFNTAEGFSSTYRTRTFQGGFIITQQTLEDRQLGRAKDDANAFIKRWHGDVVEYSMAAISAGFGRYNSGVITPIEVTWGSTANGGVSKLKLTSADTTDGSLDGVKNPLFCKYHTTVKRDGGDAVIKQSNVFYADIDLAGSDAGKIAKLADVINQVITQMENYKDDNGKRAGVIGEKTIVCGNDAHLKAALETAVSMDMFNGMGQPSGLNPAYKRAVVKTTPYLLDIPQCKDGIGFFIVDKAYNAANHGPEMTERIALTLDVNETKRPNGITYDGRERFDINAASWRGIAYVLLGSANLSKTSTDWNYAGATSGAFTDATSPLTQVVPTETIVKPVSVTGTVTTKSST